MSTGAGTLIKFDSNGNGSAFATNLTDAAGLAVDASANFDASKIVYNGPRTNTTGGYNLYVMNGNAIEKFDPNGNMSLFATSTLSNPYQIAVDSSSNLYVANFGTIEKFDANGHESIFASGFNIFGLACDRSGNLYVETFSAIEEFDPGGNESVFASSGIHLPGGLAFDSNGNLFVSNNSGSEIRKFDSSGNGALFTSDVDVPNGLAFDRSGNLYVADFGDSKIEEFSPSGVETNFATGLYQPRWIAIQVPEPATIALMTLGMCVSLFSHRLRRRSS